MGIRFRRSVTVAPGLRLNFSGSGVSMSAGPRGASMTFGSRGTYFNTGIPGTGLYSRTRLDTSSSSSRALTSSGLKHVMVKLQITLEDDGSLKFVYDGKPAPDYLVNKAKREHGDQIREMVSRSCEKMNATAKALVELYRETPAPDDRIRFQPGIFEEAAPRKPASKPHGFLGWLFKSIAARIDAENQAAQDEYNKGLARWQKDKAAFEAAEVERKHFLEELVFTDAAAMEKHFEQALLDISWPRETKVSFEILDKGKAIAIDVDLPEIEDMPKTHWSLPARGYKPTIKAFTESQIAKMYSEHVQGIGFRIMGEAFALLPSIERITVSAYTQRPSSATGVEHEDYVYSVRAAREAWSRINFKNLAALEVGEALARFELRRDVLKNGRMRAIEPFAGIVEVTTA